MILLDATMLLIIVAPDVATPKDADGREIRAPKLRMDGLIASLAERKQKIIIPTPALCEALVRTDPKSAGDYVEKLKKSRNFRIEPFCERAALEVAVLTRQAIARGDKKGGSEETWAKIKYDRQIIGIAAVHGVAAIYTDDKNLTSAAQRHGFCTVGLADVPIPDENAQIDWVDEVQRDR